MGQASALQEREIDQDRLGEFMGRFVNDLGAAMHAPTVIIGEKLGLYRALAEAGPLTPQELADRTRTAERLVDRGTRADLLVGNNVLAHVPDINDFVAGLARLLAPAGVITMEFPHLQRLMEGNQFDTIYHEHFSYFSFTTAVRIFAAHGLTVFDVEELPTHGGSLRVYARHDADASKPVGERVRGGGARAASLVAELAESTREAR